MEESLKDAVMRITRELKKLDDEDAGRANEAKQDKLMFELIGTVFGRIDRIERKLDELLERPHV